MGRPRVIENLSRQYWRELLVNVAARMRRSGHPDLAVQGDAIVAGMGEDR